MYYTHGAFFGYLQEIPESKYPPRYTRRCRTKRCRMGCIGTQPLLCPTLRVGSVHRAIQMDS